MSLRTPVLALPIALALAASFATAQSETAAGGSMLSRTDEMLRASLENKRGLTFYVNGQMIGGGVKEIGSDYVVVANQEHGRILIRFASIDAIAGN